MQDGHRQDPLISVIATGERERDLRTQEAEEMLGAAADLRRRAFNLPPESEIRAMFLRSAARYVAASSEVLGPHLRLARPG
jgi:hypothetical protein